MIITKIPIDYISYLLLLCNIFVSVVGKTGFFNLWPYTLSQNQNKITERQFMNSLLIL